MKEKLRLRPAGAMLGAALGIVASLPIGLVTLLAFVLVVGGIASCAVVREVR